MPVTCGGERTEKRGVLLHFHWRISFPNEKAAEIAVATVKEFLAQKETSVEKVIFNVFKDRDREIYEELLGEK